MPPRRPRNNHNNGRNQGNGNGNNGGEFAQNFVAAVQAIIQQQNQGGQNQGNNAPNPPAMNNSQVIEQFRRYTPPRFTGRDGPLVLEEWLRELERIFNHMECTDAHKVSCAVFQLSEEAGHWWESHQRTGGDRLQNPTWELFKEEITEKYFPDSYKDEKEAEFFNFKQGTLSVIDYEREFNQLSRYAIHLVNTDAKKAKRFRKGLRPEIGGVLAAQEVTISYGEMVRRAQEVALTLKLENSLSKPPSSSLAKRKWDGQNTNYGNGLSEKKGNFQNKKGNFEVKTGTSTPGIKPQCPECGKHHNGVCYQGKGVCYWCKEPGHNANTCPKQNQIQTEKRGNARVFALTQKEAEDEPNVMAGATF